MRGHFLTVDLSSHRAGFFLTDRAHTLTQLHPLRFDLGRKFGMALLCSDGVARSQADLDLGLANDGTQVLGHALAKLQKRRFRTFGWTIHFEDHVYRLCVPVGRLQIP